MIKQTVSYGVWTINRHDDNKIEVLKNGQLCEKIHSCSPRDSN